METAMQTQTEQAGMPAQATHNTYQNSTDMIFDPQAMMQMHQIAEVMAKGVSTIPTHLRGNVSDCMAVVMQASQWRMNPYAVAQKTHLVSGALGYEGQLVNAVVASSTKIEGSFHYEWFGPWERVIGKFVKRKSQKGNEYMAPGWTDKDEEGCGIIVSATLRGEDAPRELKLLLSQAQVRNSTLWASDPKQQLAYLGVKRWARLYAPDVILGVYTPDELDDTSRKERELNPMQKAPAATKSKALNKAMDDAGEISSNAVALIKKCEGAATMAALKTVYAEIATAAQAGKLTVSDRTELNKVYTTCKAELEAIEADEQAQAGGDE